jgi:cyclohexadienyl dehydratase
MRPRFPLLRLVRPPACARAALPALIALALVCPRLASAGDVLDRIGATHAVRVCIWPEYYGIAWRDPRTGELSGIDVDMSRALAADLGVRVTYVETTFASFEADLREQRCDVAMFALAVTAARERLVRFTQPYLQSDIYALAMRDSGVVREWADIDRPGVSVGVQANTFMEPVMRAALRHARLVVLPPEVLREGELQAGRVDVVMTDFPYGHRLLENADWARLIAPPAPFHPVQYAYAVRPGDSAWLARLNTFVARIRGDGRLAEAARRYHLTEVLLPR